MVPTWLSERLHHARVVLVRPVTGVIAFVVAWFEYAAFIKGDTLPLRLQLLREKLLVRIVPDVSGTAWLVLGLLAVLGVVLEGTYRHARTLRVAKATNDGLDELMRHRGAGIQLQAKGEGLAAAGITGWVQDFMRWRVLALTFLKTHLPEHEWRQFADLGEIPLTTWVGMGPHPDPTHLQVMRELRVCIRVLDDLLRVARERFYKT